MVECKTTYTIVLMYGISRVLKKKRNITYVYRIKLKNVTTEPNCEFCEPFHP